MRKDNIPGFEYKPYEEKDGYLENWFVEYDLMCTSKTDVNKIVSLFFFGYLFGVGIFFLPDSFGRKFTMNIILPFYIISAYLTAFGNSMEIKGLGFFL